MRFIPSTGFHQIGSLWLRGWTNIPHEELSRRFANGDFPDELRGNFALVYDDGNYFFACCDHIATYPLFYGNDHIGSIYADIASVAPASDPSPEFLAQRELLGGQTIGPSTPNSSITRLEPGYVLDKSGNTRRFIDPAVIAPDGTFSVDEFTSTVENVIRTNLKENNALLLSAGTDSVTLAAILRKLDVLSRVRLLHVHSHLQPLSERSHCERIAAEMGLAVEYVEQAYSGDIIPEISDRQFSFWIENPFPAKKAAVISAGAQNCRLITGELGDQLFGGPKNAILMKYVSQVSRPDPRTIARIWINQSTTYGKHHSIDEDPKVVSIMSTPSGKRAYDEIVTFIKDAFMRMPHETYLERFMRLNLLVKGPYRAWAYSQDDLDWFSPFADWRIAEIAMRAPVREHVGENGLGKSLLLHSWRQWISSVPWELKKHGFGVPALSKFRSHT